jgi:hypothetical protein
MFAKNSRFAKRTPAQITYAFSRCDDAENREYFTSPAIVLYRSELVRALTIDHVISNEVRDLYKGTLYVSNGGDFSLRSK